MAAREHFWDNSNPRAISLKEIADKTGLKIGDA